MMPFNEIQSLFDLRHPSRSRFSEFHFNWHAIRLELFFPISSQTLQSASSSAYTQKKKTTTTKNG